MSDQVQLAVVGLLVVLAQGVIGLVMLVAKEYFDRKRAEAAAVKVEAVRVEAAKAATKAHTVSIAMTEVAAAQQRQIRGVSEQVEEVHKATNGMKAQLVDEVRKASFAAGEKSEQNKK